MAGQVTIRGAIGQVRWAYTVAADLTSYSVTRTVDGWTLRATVREAHPFRLSQYPLMFVAPHAKGEWRWPVQTCEVSAGVLTAQLGPPEG